MRRPIWIFSLAAAAFISAGAALASAGGIVVDLNRAVRVPFAGSAANVVIANPSVVDVAMVDGHSVVVIGKGYGVTQIIVTDHDGHTLLNSRVAVVGAEINRVTVYRGITPSEYDCTVRCENLGAGEAVTNDQAATTTTAAQQPVTPPQVNAEPAAPVVPRSPP